MEAFQQRFRRALGEFSRLWEIVESATMALPNRETEREDDCAYECHYTAKSPVGSLRVSITIPSRNPDLETEKIVVSLYLGSQFHDNEPDYHEPALQLSSAWTEDWYFCAITDHPTSVVFASLCERFEIAAGEEREVDWTQAQHLTLALAYALSDLGRTFTD